MNLALVPNIAGPKTIAPRKPPTAKPGLRLSVQPLETALALAGIEEASMDKRYWNAMAKARFRGYITLTFADEIACKVLRQHPFTIWGDEYERVVWHDMNDEAETPDTATVYAFPSVHDAPMAA